MFRGFTRRQVLGGLLGLVGMALGRRKAAPARPPAPRTPPGGPVAYGYTSYECGQGRVTTYVYDARGRLSRTYGPVPCAGVTTYTYHPEAGRWGFRG